MDLPFSAEQFLDIFARYNSDIWPMQLVFYLFAAIAIIALFVDYSKKDKVINLVLSFFWIWMGIGYHIVYFSEINPIAIFFGGAFIIQGLMVANLGLLKRQLQYRLDRTTHSVIGMILVFFSLFIYPVLSYSFGHVFPKMPTFGLPCPTTIFTLGILLLSVDRLSWYIYLIPVLWSVIGFSAAIQLSIREDFSLGISGLIALFLFIAKGRKSRANSLADKQ